MSRVAGSAGVDVNSSVPSQMLRPSAHPVPAPGTTWPTLRMSTATGLSRIVAVMVNVTVPPLEATAIGAPSGDPVPLAGGPHDDAGSPGAHVQVAVAPSSSRGSGSEKVP